MEKSPGPESEKDMKVVLMQKQNLIGDSLGIGEKSLRESLEKGGKKCFLLTFFRNHCSVISHV